MAATILLRLACATRSDQLCPLEDGISKPQTAGVICPTSGWGIRLRWIGICAQPGTPSPEASDQFLITAFILRLTPGYEDLP